MVWRVLSCSLLLTFVLIYGAASAADWQRGTPESQGVRSQVIAEFLNRWQQDQLPLHSLIVVRRGELIHQSHGYPFRAEGMHDVASCTKTVTGLLVGIAIDQRKLRGVDGTLEQLVPEREIAKLDERKRAVRLEDLLTMRSGFASLNDGLTLFQMLQSPDWAQYALDLGMMRSPGETFQYLSVNSHLMAAAIQQAAGVPTKEFARRELFEPLGIKDFGWPEDPQGVAHGWGDLRLHPADLARIGQLILQRGAWEGKQVVSSAWIEDATRTYAETKRAEYPGYGYHCWIGAGRIAAIGRGCQRVIVVPDRELVIVAMAGADLKQEQQIDQMCRDLIASIDPEVNALPDDPAGRRELHAAQAALLAAPAAREPSNTAEIAERIGAHWYRLGSNPFVERFRLSFDKGKEARLELQFQAASWLDPLVVDVGLDGEPRMSQGRFNEPAAATGEWTGPRSFRVDLDEIGNINRWQIEIAFENESEVEFKMREATGLPPVRVRGTRE